MISKSLLTTLLVLILTACSTTKYIDVPVKVEVPVKCKVELPDGEINESLNVSEKYIEVLKYISKIHKNIKRCQ